MLLVSCPLLRLPRCNFIPSPFTEYLFMAVDIALAQLVQTMHERYIMKLVSYKSSKYGYLLTYDIVILVLLGDFDT